MRVLKRADRSGAPPRAGEPWPLASVEIVEARDEENIARSFVDRAILEGWASFDRGSFVIHAEPETLTYRIVRGPGRYCAHCHAPLDDEQQARAHLELEHADEASPDSENPAGWYVSDYYACEKGA